MPHTIVPPLSALPPAMGADFMSGDIDYIIATDPVYFEVANRPLKNLAQRDNDLQTTLNATITELNNGYAGSAIVAASDLGHGTTQANLQAFMQVIHNADGTLKAAAIPTVSSVTGSLQGLLTLADQAKVDSLARAECPSGFCKFAPIGSQVDGGLAGGLAINSLRLFNTIAVVAGTVLNIGQFDIPLPTAPIYSPPGQVGVRQDIVFMEVWKESAHPLMCIQTNVNSPAANTLTFATGVDLSAILHNGDFVEYVGGISQVVSVAVAGAGPSAITTVVVSQTLVSFPTNATVRLLAKTPKFFRYGNTQYSGASFDGLGVTIGIVTDPISLLSIPEYRYVTGTQQATSNPEQADVRGTVELGTSGQFVQVRFRFRVGQNVDVGDATIYPNIHSAVVDTLPYLARYVTVASHNYIMPQGASDTPATYLSSGAFRQSASDTGLFVEASLTTFAAQNGGIIFNQGGNYFSAIPVAFINRRNTTAWTMANYNGSDAQGFVLSNSSFNDPMAWANIGLGWTLGNGQAVKVPYASGTNIVSNAQFNASTSVDIEIDVSNVTAGSLTVTAGGSYITITASGAYFFRAAITGAAPLVIQDPTGTFSGTITSLKVNLVTTRPDKKFYDVVVDSDCLDLRHRVMLSNYDLPSLFDETTNALLSCKAAMNWDSYMIDPTGLMAYAASGIWGTKILYAEGIDQVGLEFTWGAIRCVRSVSPNSTLLNPDGIRNYYSDEAGIQEVYGKIPNSNSDSTNPCFDYTSSIKSLVFNAEDFQASEDGSAANRPMISSGKVVWGTTSHNTALVGQPNLVWGSYSTVPHDTVTFTMNALTPAAINLSGSVNAPAMGTPVTVNGIACVVNGVPINGGTVTAISVTFIGTTPPSTGTVTGLSGSVNATSVAVGFLYPMSGGTPQSSNTQYVGEGYNLNPASPMFATAYVQWTNGSSMIRRVPTSNSSLYYGMDAFKGAYWAQNGSLTNVLPGNGQGYVPLSVNHNLSLYISDGVSGAQLSSPHTRATHLGGLVNLTPAITTGMLVSGADTAIGSSSVIYSGSTYKMWYGSTAGILYSTSTDGVHWNTPVACTGLTNGGQATTAGDPSVIYDASVTLYKMWYTGIDGGGVTRIMYATSADGQTWSGVTMVQNFARTAGLDGTGVMQPTVIKTVSDSPGPYKMWYACNNTGTLQIGYATSTDGVTWTVPALVLSQVGSNISIQTSVTNPYVIKETAISSDVTYRMWFSGLATGSSTPTIQYATSSDGVNWSSPEVLIIPGNTVRFDSTFVGAPAVIKHGTLYLMWYVGGSSGLTGTSILSTILTLTDAANVGSSQTGVYSSMGTLNYAIGANDSLVLFYESMAQQQDWSFIKGTLSTGTGELDFSVLYVPEDMYSTSMGTGSFAFDAAAKQGAPNIYRDAHWGIVHQSFAQIIPGEYALGASITGIDPSDFPGLPGAGNQAQPFVCSTWGGYWQQGANKPVRTGAAVKITGLQSNGLFNLATEYLTSSLNSSILGDANGVPVSKYSFVAPPTPCGYFSFMGVVGRIGQELVMPAANYVSSIGGPVLALHPAIFPLVGRPLIK